MADPRFYKRQGPFTLAQLKEFGQCEDLRGNPDLTIEDVSSLETAQPSHISLFTHPRYREAFASTKAGACVVSPEMVEKAPSHLSLLVAKYPSRAFALIGNTFYPAETKEASIDPTAIIHPTAKLGKNVVVGPQTIIEADAEIGDFVHIGPLTLIGKGVVMGEHTTVGSHVSLTHALVGKHVNIKSGARIGQSGFGFFMDSGDAGGHVPVPQLGRVIIEDYVEIGSNTTIDRGSGPDTVIGVGTRIDNLVQVAHNVRFGKGCVMVAQVGIAGSTQFGDYVVAGGQAGFTEHLRIGSFARFGAQSGILRNVDSGEMLAGSPAMPLKAHHRQVVILKKLEENTRKKAKSR